MNIRDQGWTYEVTKTIYPKDVYPNLDIFLAQLHEKGYEVLEFRPPKQGDRFVYSLYCGIKFDIIVCQKDTDKQHPRLIVSRKYSLMEKLRQCGVQTDFLCNVLEIYPPDIRIPEGYSPIAFEYPHRYPRQHYLNRMGQPSEIVSGSGTYYTPRIILRRDS